MAYPTDLKTPFIVVTSPSIKGLFLGMSKYALSQEVMTRHRGLAKGTKRLLLKTPKTRLIKYIRKT